MQIRPAGFPDDFHSLAEIFREYADSLPNDLCREGFAEEVATLPGKYAPPTGALLVAEAETELAACIALRRHSPTAGEMKRLYVRPAYRRHGLGRMLLERVMAEASAIGYREMVFDTLPTMTDARRIYDTLGFVETEPYNSNQSQGALFFRKSLVA